ncbi:GGDEF domain-containing protein [Deinococcus fonticola]|uniref:GGDEF domain-containing protein n=1 Tax=Deinococcus fonticola TaxID=2528713 RepID=UPI001074E887|nr:GGDEF domain-containing protein [Deinococcus fonticola]
MSADLPSQHSENTHRWFWLPEDPHTAPDIMDALRRRLYIFALLFGLPVVLLVWLLEFQNATHNPAFNLLYPALLIVLLGTLYWLKSNRPLPPIERTMYVANAITFTVQFLTIRSTPSSEVILLLVTAYLMLLANTTIGYLMFGTRLAGYLSLGTFTLSVVLCSVMIIQTHPAALMISATRLQLSVAALLVLIHSLSWYRSIYTRIYSERLQMQLELYTDPLTELPNRRAAYRAIEHLLTEAGNGTSGSIILLDIDHFKRVNDQYGHPTGDSVLHHFAQLLRSSTREQDTPSRWGGEEFLIVLPATTLSQAAALAQRIRQTLNTTEHDTVGRVTASCGVTTLHSGDDLSRLVARADEALYRAKAKGRNQVVASQDALSTALEGHYLPPATSMNEPMT